MFGDLITLSSNISSFLPGLSYLFWTINVVTHEMGPALSSPAYALVRLGGRGDRRCGPDGGLSDRGRLGAGPTPTNSSTIMSYCHLLGIGINFANGFRPAAGRCHSRCRNVG
ncbi:MAG: hypothetical protein IPK76_19530 [Lewinellaceae bacterium]|nr:hypothetical protein [Lewinellaceae bacterium]